MHLGTETLASLKIFDSETHANLHLSTTKEGLSLYGILNECVTHGGKLLLKNWLIRPSKDIEVIKSRQDEIEFYLKNENAQFFEKARSILKNLGNINRTIMVINSGKSRMAEWSRLLRAIKACREIQRLTSNLENAHKTELLNKVGFDVKYLDDLKEKINSTLDWEESKINGGCINVLPGVDEELDELREQYSGLESKLQHLAQELRTMAAFDSIPEFAINYFPQIGYICTIPRPLEWDGNDFLIEKGWQFHFATDTELHYKNDYMRDLDLHIGDLATAISDREIEIVHLLEEDLERATPLLISFAEVLAEFDCILSLANSAYQRDWKRPSIVPENIIQITGGRHPLVEGSVETCISNDAFLKNSENITTSTCENYAELEAEYPKIEGRNILGRSILVVTGANFSGKSVYVKQLGVIAILSQIGSFVPAEETTIGIHDAIFTRITTTESVTKNSSAFMIDLQQISFMLRNCTAQSILLIDEFGKGTDSSDGQALFCSLINHLVERGSECPITILTTHFHEVFTRGYLPADLPIDFGHMSMVMPSGSEHEVDRSPIYLYKLKPGIISSSHALSCAAISGVPKHIRIRADRVSRMLGNFEILKLLDVCMTDEEIEDLRRMEKVVRRFVETNFESGTSDDEQNFMIHLSRHILSEYV
ncbi:DNA mismatch repair protein MutS [Phakopsora pachyrhizi]|uniref:DNA mismatch repair protein muts n=1 Tax=Phakopsora pachyrhizi TaxID=170000 RepID=A0AAV0BGR1_PHAPC|nr:DNA mismatch repair protein MutS [Phakopsora pachyrhizi]CAH7685094.1 DNA mismatch repair protein muts [Phakopsora pachyrhizi]